MFFSLTINPCDLDESTELLIVFQQDPQLHILRVLGVVLAPLKEYKLLVGFSNLNRGNLIFNHSPTTGRSQLFYTAFATLANMVFTCGLLKVLVTVHLNIFVKQCTQI